MLHLGGQSRRAGGRYTARLSGASVSDAIRAGSSRGRSEVAVLGGGRHGRPAAAPEPPLRPATRRTPPELISGRSRTPPSFAAVILTSRPLRRQSGAGLPFRGGGTAGGGKGRAA